MGSLRSQIQLALSPSMAHLPLDMGVGVFFRGDLDEARRDATHRLARDPNIRLGQRRENVACYGSKARSPLR